jgi:septal ring factor EnvC (AmiA/AmiB activator)
MTRADELQTILNDLRFLEDEKVGLEHELRETRSMNSDLMKRNEDLEARLEKKTVEHDKIQAFAINIVTRLQVIGENVANVIQEAGRGAISTAGRLQEQRREAERVAAPIRQPRQVIEPRPVPAPLRVPREINPDEGPDEQLAELMGRLKTEPPPVRY